MKHINGQSSKEESFLLNSRTNHFASNGDTSFHPCSFGKDRDGSQAHQQDQAKPLLSYLFFSGETSKVQEQPQRVNSCHLGKSFGKEKFEEESQGRTSCLNFMDRYRVNRKVSGNERFRTDVGDFSEDVYQELEKLRRENEMLKSRLVKSEKTIISLETVQSELEYMKKLSFLQQTEIEKLRILVKQTRQAKVQLESPEHLISNEGLPHHIDVSLTEKCKLRDFNRKSTEQSIQDKRKTLKKKGREAPKGKENQSVFLSKSETKKYKDEEDEQFNSKIGRKHSIQSKRSNKSQQKRLFP